MYAAPTGDPPAAAAGYGVYRLPLATALVEAALPAAWTGDLPRPFLVVASCCCCSAAITPALWARFPRPYPSTIGGSASLATDRFFFPAFPLPALADPASGGECREEDGAERRLSSDAAGRLCSFKRTLTRTGTLGGTIEGSVRLGALLGTPLRRRTLAALGDDGSTARAERCCAARATAGVGRAVRPAEWEGRGISVNSSDGRDAALGSRSVWSSWTDSRGSCAAFRSRPSLPRYPAKFERA